MNITAFDSMAAYNKNKPIKTPEQKIKGKEMHFKPINEEWNASARNKFWHSEYNGCLNENETLLITLRDRLLEFCGEQALLPSEEDDFHQIMQRGQFWYGDKSDIMKGRPNQCHRNSSRLWEVNQDKSLICTGYAITEDGIWRQHSWLVHIKPRVNRIIETTIPRIAYYGYVMTPQECVNFAIANY